MSSRKLYNKLGAVSFSFAKSLKTVKYRIKSSSQRCNRGWLQGTIT